MNNPHLEVAPDFMLPELEDERLILTVKGRAEEEAAALLLHIWQVKHKKDCMAWDRERENRTRAERDERDRSEQEATQARLAREQEIELAKQEERKRYKNKFLPIPDRPLPPRALFLPPQHAMNKLRKGEYVPLYYFTNKGIHEVEEETPNLDDDVLTLVCTESGPVFQSTTAVKARECKVPDEDLTWEEFSESNHWMLKAMAQQDWPEEWINMIQNFWLAIKGHEFRHGDCEYTKRALLLYQACIREQWHQSIGMTEAFALVLLSKYHLALYQKRLRDAAVNSQIEAL